MVTLIFAAAALLPAFFLMKYIYRMDTREKESTGLLVKLVIFGALAGTIAGTLNQMGIGVLSLFFEKDSVIYTLCLAFLVVGVVEEGCKFFFLKLGSWSNPNFNYRFDGIVYAAFVSLGFAALENLTYVFSYGLSVAIPRALLSVPAHMGFAVFMGSYYGRAKLCEGRGDYAGAKQNRLHGYLIAVFLHGFYDSCAMIGSTISMILFWAFVVIMYIVVIRRVRRESATDQSINGADTGFPFV